MRMSSVRVIKSSMLSAAMRRLRHLRQRALIRVIRIKGNYSFLPSRWDGDKTAQVLSSDSANSRLSGNMFEDSFIGSFCSRTCFRMSPCRPDYLMTWLMTSGNVSAAGSLRVRLTASSRLDLLILSALHATRRTHHRSLLSASRIRGDASLC